MYKSISNFSEQFLLFLLFIIPVGINAQIQWNLPPDFTSSITAATYLPSSKSVAFCSGPNMRYDPIGNGSPTAWTGVAGFSKIDAALNFYDQELLFFQGGFYQGMDLNTGELSGQWAPWPGLPTHWNNQLDAAVTWATGTFVFFKGLEFTIYDAATQQYVQQGLVSEWAGWPDHWNDGFNATFCIDGIVYFFRGTEIIAFNQQTKNFITASPVAAQFPNKKSNSNGSLGETPQYAALPLNKEEGTDTGHPMYDGSDEESSVESHVHNHDPKVHGKFRTDYEDFEEGYRQDKAFTGNSGNLKVAGYDWLGAGIDITKYNPIFPVNSWTADRSPIITTLSSKTGGNRGSDLLPWGCVAQTRSSVKGSISSKWIKSYKDFVQAFKMGGEASIGVGKSGEKIAGADFSGSFREVIRKKVGSEVIYHVQKTHRSIYNLTMDLTWRDPELGLCRQKISTAFEDDIKNLSDNPNTKECNAIIEKYGTHIAVGMRMGGIHLVLTEIEKSDFEDSRMTEQQFKAKASGTIKKVSVGAAVEFSSMESNTEGGATSTFDRETMAIGGHGHEDKKAWADKLKEDPVATSISMVPMWEILNDKFFFGDPNIKSKKVAIQKAIQAYIKANTEPAPKNEAYNFFDVKNHLTAGGPKKAKVKEKPGKLRLQNRCHYVLEAEVNYKVNGADRSPIKISNIHHNRNGERVIPAGATDIHILVKWKDGFEWRVLGEKYHDKNGAFTLTANGKFLQPPTLSEG